MKGGLLLLAVAFAEICIGQVTILGEYATLENDLVQIEVGKDGVRKVR